MAPAMTWAGAPTPTAPRSPGTPAPPDAAGAFAYFKGNGGTATLDAARTVGTMTFRSGSAYTVANGGSGSLTINDGSGANGTGAINVQPAVNPTTGAVLPVTHTIAAP